MCIVIVERLADGILRVKHGVAVSSFNSSNVIIIDKILMLIFVALDHSRLIDGILVVRDSTEQSFW